MGSIEVVRPDWTQFELEGLIHSLVCIASLVGTFVVCVVLVAGLQSLSVLGPALGLDSA